MWLIFAAAALASTSSQLIAEDVQAGALTDEEGLWLSYLAHFEPQDLPDRYQGDEAPGFLCAMPLVEELRRHWGSFDPAQRQRMTRHLTPWKADLLDPMPQRSIEGPPPPSASSTCWAQQAPNLIQTAHFQVEYEDGVSRSMAEDFGDALEYAFSEELAEGWRPVEGMDRYLMWAYIQNGGGAGAYTSVEWCNGIGGYMPYIVAGEASFSSGVWYQDMAAHEYNHAIQFGYHNAVYLSGSSGGWDLWLWEATAVWEQEQVYPTHNIWSQYLQGYTEQPWMSMDASSQSDQAQFWHLYGMTIFDFYLEEYYGGPDRIREHWEYVEDTVPTTLLDIEEVTEDLGYAPWSEVYSHWLAANTVMDYREQRYFSEIDIARRITGLPAEGLPRTGEEPWGRGANFVRIDGDLGTSAEPDLHLLFEGEAGGDWLVLLVGTDDDEVQEIIDVPVVDDAADFTVSDFERHEYWWLILSPLSSRRITYDYSYSLDRVAPPFEPPEWFGEYGPFYMSVDGEAADPDATRASAEELEGAGRGCASAPGGGWVGLLLLLPLVARRRGRATSLA